MWYLDKSILVDPNLNCMLPVDYFGREALLFLWKFHNMHAVLVHGIFNTSKVFFLMKKSLEAHDIACITPELRPKDGKYGIEDLANKLRLEINNILDQSQKFILIGFSMGGIISRYYLQYLGGAKRISHFFSISAPHHGSYLAYLYPGKGTKQLRPGSEFLADLNANEDNLNHTKLFSFWTPLDLTIIPSSSSRWERSINIKVYSLLHPLMVFNKQVINGILARLPG